MRKLRYHEQKLLKKVDFIDYKSENNLRELEILRRYRVEREDYGKYNRICGLIKKIATKIEKLEDTDKIRIQTSKELIEKLFNLGAINHKKNLLQCKKVPASAFCRRRLPVVLVTLKMAETLKNAVTLIEQGHIRVGPETITDPAFLITRSMEDFVTWVEGSKVRRHIANYRNEVDDYDLNEC